MELMQDVKPSTVSAARENTPTSHALNRNRSTPTGPTFSKDVQIARHLAGTRDVHGQPATSAVLAKSWPRLAPEAWARCIVALDCGSVHYFGVAGTRAWAFSP